MDRASLNSGQTAAKLTLRVTGCFLAVDCGCSGSAVFGSGKRRIWVE
jgi:hypothetical protein